MNTSIGCGRKDRGMPGDVTDRDRPAWWKPPWRLGRRTKADDETAAAVSAGGVEVGDDEVEGPNSA
jgi:hypothetical protein